MKRNRSFIIFPLGNANRIRFSNITKVEMFRGYKPVIRLKMLHCYSLYYMFFMKYNLLYRMHKEALMEALRAIVFKKVTVSKIC
jgi:hypothetical protein